MPRRSVTDSSEDPFLDDSADQDPYEREGPDDREGSDPEPSTPRWLVLGAVAVVIVSAGLLVSRQSFPMLATEQDGAPAPSTRSTAQIPALAVPQSGPNTQAIQPRITFSQTPSAQATAQPPGSLVPQVVPPAQGPVLAQGVDWAALSRQVSPSLVRIAMPGSGTPALGVVVGPTGEIVVGAQSFSQTGLPDGQVQVTTARDTSLRAVVMGIDPVTDLVLLRAAGSSGLTPIALADSGQVQVGDAVASVAMSTSGPAMTAGVVTAVAHSVNVPAQGARLPDNRLPSTGAGTKVATTVIQSDAALPGSSGGPLLDRRGAMIGMTSPMLASLASTGGQTLSTATPSNLMATVLLQLDAGKSSGRPMLGVQVAAAEIPIGGVTRTAPIIEAVTPGSAADAAGLRRGDAILSIDGQPLTSGRDLADAMAARAAGVTARFSISRKGDALIANITLGR